MEAFLPTDIDQVFLSEHTALLVDSYQHWMANDLLPGLNDGNRVSALFSASFALLSHNTAAVPVFNYANRSALELFEMNWADFTCLQSRHSAEAENREQRQVLLSRVTEKGFIDHYSGIRISASGRRFRIEEAIIWNIIDKKGVYRGQAALFDKWTRLD